MPAAVPFLPSIFAGVSAGAATKSAIDARKGQKEQLAQTERLATESAANQAQGETQAQDIFARKRSRRTPGFSDAGAAPPSLGGTAGAYLGA